MFVLEFQFSGWQCPSFDRWCQLTSVYGTPQKAVSHFTVIVPCRTLMVSPFLLRPYDFEFLTHQILIPIKQLRRFEKNQFVYWLIAILFFKYKIKLYILNCDFNFTFKVRAPFTTMTWSVKVNFFRTSSRSKEWHCCQLCCSKQTKGSRRKLWERQP